VSAATSPDRASLDRVVPRVDAWRDGVASPVTPDGSAKEWMHFCVRLPGTPAGHLLINVSVTERLLPTGPERAARLMALAVAEGTTWSGTVRSFTDEEAAGRAGEIALRMGDNRLSWSDGAFGLSLRTDELSAELRLAPLTLPTTASGVSLGASHAIHWVVLPRLEATGWVRLEGARELRLDRALAYHDHNWGRFRWGGDLAWEWGFVHPRDPACPWSVVFARVSDGGRHRTLSQGALVWRGDALVRTFQDREVLVSLEGTHGGPRPLTLPRVASLLVPGASAGVPARLRVAAAGQGERLRLDFATRSKARVAIPSDVDPFRLVLLNETCGDAQVAGETAAGAFQFDGPAIMEFVRG
jgi:hypothetical protein